MKPSVARKLDAILNPPGQERLPLVQAADRMRQATYRQRKELTQKERDTIRWASEAARASASADYYRDLIDRCAPHLGDAFHVCDDGTRSQDPLRAKLPDLVRDLRARVSVAGMDTMAYWEGHDQASNNLTKWWAEAVDGGGNAILLGEPLRSLYARTRSLATELRRVQIFAGVFAITAFVTTALWTFK